MWLCMPSNEWTISFVIYGGYKVPPAYSPSVEISFHTALSMSTWKQLETIPSIPGSTIPHSFWHLAWLSGRLSSQVQTSQHSVLHRLPCPTQHQETRCHLHLAVPPSMFPFVTVFSLLLQWLRLRASQNFLSGIEYCCVSHILKGINNWSQISLRENCLVRWYLSLSEYSVAVKNAFFFFFGKPNSLSLNLSFAMPLVVLFKLSFPLASSNEDDSSVYCVMQLNQMNCP